jgi:hypothetical protein
MRATAFASLVLLAACGDSPAPEHNAYAETVRNQIECRFPGAEQFERSCTFEREGADGAVLLIRKPDGGFRRLRVVADGRGVIAADGAEAARVTILTDNRIEVQIGGDRFRLPATVRRR